MSSASNQRGLYNITNSNSNSNKNNQNITTESFIPGNFYKVVYRKYSRGNFSSGYVESVFYNVTEASGVYELINGLTNKEINNANKLGLSGDQYVLLINVNEEYFRDRGKLELVILDEVRSVKKLKNNEFSGLNLSGLQLQGAKLQGVVLENVNLKEANLEGAKLQRVVLEEVNLEGANLERAYLTEADLRGANLKGTTLMRAKLQKAHLEGVNLNGFDLYGAKLKGAHLQGVQLQKACLVNADLRNADLRGADLRGAKLQGAKLEGAKLEGAKLEGARIIDTNLNRASLTGPQRNGIIIIPKKNWNTSLNTTNNNNNHSGGRFLQNKLKSGNSKTRSVKAFSFIASKKI
jgi:uncharacterized protein YjbI with pentapeptide repeats